MNNESINSEVIVDASAPVEETAVESPVEETAVESPVEETVVESPVEETVVESPVDSINDRMLRVGDKMVSALQFDIDSATMTVDRKDGTTTDIIKKVYKFTEPIGNRNQLTIMDLDLIQSIDTIQGAINVRKMSNYVICKEFSRINDSGKLEKLGFKTIGELGKAIFGLETSTVNHYARIGTLFITDDYNVNPMLPELSVSHLLELEAYENGDVEKISELYQKGTLVDGMSTKKIRETLKGLREKGIEDKGVENGDTENTDTTDTDSNSVDNVTDNSSSDSNQTGERDTEPTAESVEQLSATFDKQIVVGKMLNYCEVMEQLFALLKEHDIEVVDYATPIDTIKAMIQSLL